MISEYEFSLSRMMMFPMINLITKKAMAQENVCLFRMVKTEVDKYEEE